MNQGVKLLKFDGEEPRTIARVPSPEVELKHFQNVVGNVTQDALNTWDEIWGELQHAGHTGVMIVPEAAEEPPGPDADSSAGAAFKPSCGWPEFMEKMWLLRHYLDFMARFSRQ
jgi:hypothetical protein